MEPNTRYWIQEQAPAGNFFDSVGLSPGTVEDEAIAEFHSWRKTFPNRQCRLVARTDTVVAD